MLNDFRKNKKIAIIFIFLLVIILISIVIFLTVNTNEEKLLLTCSNKTSTNEIIIENNIKLTNIKNGRKYYQTLNFYIQSNLTDEERESMYSMLEERIKNQIEKESEKLINKISYSLNRGDELLSFNINYIINEENVSEAYIMFDYDLFDNSIDEIKEFFENGGLVCESY